MNKNLRTLLAVGGWVKESEIVEGEEMKRIIFLGYGNERFCCYC